MAHSSEMSVVCYLTCVFILLVTFSLVLSEEVPYKTRLSRSVHSTVIDYQLKEHDKVQRFRRDVNSSNNDIPTDSNANVTESVTKDSSTDGATSEATTAGPTTPPVGTEQTTTTTAGTTVTTSPKTTTLPPIYVNDSHRYYKSEILQNKADEHWDNYIDGHRHHNLSDSHRVAVTLDLSFRFRFYGHNVTNVTVATGGFIYMSPFVHHWLTATQYIAPLMANFDTSKGNKSDIYYKQYDDKFVVHWSNVYLQDQKYNIASSKAFDFQTILYKDGTIKFVYKKVPLNILQIGKDNHPVKVGVSDAYYMDTYIPLMGYTRRTIYEYHRVTLVSAKIRDGAVVILTPFKTCNTVEDCQTCTQHKNINFPCEWCTTINRCSDGIDWHRQQWLQKGCKDNHLLHDGNCTFSQPEKEGSDVTPIIVVVCLLVVALIVGVAGWFYYAYTHPTSTSGMWLMEHRPSQMKSKMSNIKFWKSSTPAGEKYQVESTA